MMDIGSIQWYMYSQLTKPMLPNLREQGRYQGKFKSYYWRIDICIYESYILFIRSCQKNDNCLIVKKGIFKKNH